MAVAIGLTTANKEKKDKIMAEQETKSIIFYQGEENGIVVETKDYQYSIFKDQYKKAFQVFERICKQQFPLNELYQKENQGRVMPSSSIEMDNQYSNVIAFCGDRGEGKSSCMSSFAEMLSKEVVRHAAIDAKLVNSEFILSKDIKVLDTIDPSLFDSDHNLLELLIGRMFQHIKEDTNIQDDYERMNDMYEQKICKRTKLLKQFEKVKSSMSILNKQKGIYDSLEDVDDLAVGVRLKKEITELFKLYLCYEGKRHLVLCIDDLDLNMTEGYKMAEMIRKYMINPYCIVLVAVKVDQLVDVIAAAIKKELKDTHISSEDCILMAQKYVVKLLPQSNRIDMPSALDFCNRPFLMFSSRGNVLEGGAKDAKVLLKDYVVRLIYQKTRFVFYNGIEISPIVPRNLRELRHLIAKMYVQENAWIHQEEGDSIESERGREAFKEYFFETWAAKLPDEDYKFAQDLLKYDNISTLNKYVLDYFTSRKEVNNLGGEDNKLYQLIIEKNNVAVNISFGDVMFVLQTIDKITMNQDVKNLIFLIKTYYHIRLYALYNKISIDEDYLFAKKDNKEGVRIYKSDSQIDGVNELQRLLNGSVFSYNDGTYMPREKGVVSRDKRIVSFDVIKDLFISLKGENKESAEYKKKLRLCEFIAICISGTLTSDAMDRNKSMDFDRKSMEIPYLGQHSTSRHSAIFDFLYPFYSLCNIKYAYGRFDGILEGQDVLYNIAINNKYSLLRQFLDAVNNSRRIRNKKSRIDTTNTHKNAQLRWNLFHALISDAIIRVVDVQWSISDYLLFNKNVHKSGDGGAFANLINAYKDIQKLDIKIYSVDHNPEEEDVESELWTLHFDFLDVLRMALGDTALLQKKENTEYKNLSIENELIKVFKEEDDNEDDNEDDISYKYIKSLFDVNFSKEVFPIDGTKLMRLLLSRFSVQDQSALKTILDVAIGGKQLEDNRDIIMRLKNFTNDIMNVLNKPKQQLVKSESKQTEKDEILDKENLTKIIGKSYTKRGIVIKLKTKYPTIFNEKQAIEDLQIEDPINVQTLIQRIVDKYGNVKKK